MTRPGRMLATTVLLAALAACSGASSGGTATTPATTPTTPATTTPSATASPTTPAPAPTTPAVTTTTPDDGTRLVEVTVAGGKVTGPKGRVKVRLGTRVTLQVTSDVADEVHLHGYDQHVDVPAGGTAALVFTADVPGVFEVELEQRALQLVQLQVQ